MRFAMPIALVFVCLTLAACEEENKVIATDDMIMAREAQLERDWPRAERILERVLREENNPDRRWEAWNLLLQVLKATGGDPRIGLECLEAMLAEFEDDSHRAGTILEQIGSSSLSLHQFGRAANAWSAYEELPDLTVADQVKGYRNLAKAQIGLRNFDAAEESLQQCLGLAAPDHDKIWCMVDLADMGIARQRWQDVSDICEQIQDAEPDREVLGWACYYRGDALEQLGKPAEALKQFEEARDKYPNPAVIENRIEHIKKELKGKK